MGRGLEIYAPYSVNGPVLIEVSSIKNLRAARETILSNDGTGGISCGWSGFTGSGAI